MSTNKHATIRYNAIDKCLSNSGRKYYIDDLVAFCNQAIYNFSGLDNGVKKRQVYDDLRFMKSDEGFAAPIETYKDGRRSYHRYTDPDFSINKKDVSPKEQHHIQQALEILSRFQGLPNFEWVDELKVRLNDQLPGISNQDKNPHISFQENPYLKGMEFFTPIYNAIRHERMIAVEYQNYKSEVLQHFEISPYHLKQYNNRWFVFGQSPAYDTLTNLALDRIISINEIATPFLPTKIDFETYFEDVIGVTIPEDAQLEKVVLKVTHNLYPYIASKPLHGSQKVIAREEDHIKLQLEVYINYELKSVLLSFGNAIQVESPLTLIEKLKTI
ncbi:WYL domain-containing protein [Brumimicrobium salinarum]|uniref:WYL domain-containing protein n=1 Tax=Brumimicrobium salinarum TaxID=2058658 RepID=A0A2I0R1A4_9FLAO|nr:WYL domain-containing protein [Brumimicrobium salinarum]PKR80371.1 WYL domain-containing protein [Brumimicrobium salinarum]